MKHHLNVYLLRFMPLLTFYRDSLGMKGTERSKIVSTGDWPPIELLVWWVPEVILVRHTACNHTDSQLSASASFEM
jgi:hypothetical protein